MRVNCKELCFINAVYWLMSSYHKFLYNSNNPEQIFLTSCHSITGFTMTVRQAMLLSDTKEDMKTNVSGMFTV